MTDAPSPNTAISDSLDDEGNPLHPHKGHEVVAVVNAGVLEFRRVSDQHFSHTLNMKTVDLHVPLESGNPERPLAESTVKERIEARARLRQIPGHFFRISTIGADGSHLTIMTSPTSGLPSTCGLGDPEVFSQFLKAANDVSRTGLQISPNWESDLRSFHIGSASENGALENAELFAWVAGALNDFQASVVTSKVPTTLSL